MTDENLYETLGVPRDATAKDIKRAYRKHAMKNHPDRGGDNGTFQALQKAYDVLGDAERREKYDTTGTIDPHVDSPTERARRETCALIVSCAETVAQMADPKHHSPLEVAASILAEERKKLNSEITKAKKLAKLLRVAKDRMQRKDGGENQAAMAIESRAEKEERKIEQIDARLKQICETKFELELYSYRLEEKESQLVRPGSFESMAWDFGTKAT